MALLPRIYLLTDRSVNTASGPPVAQAARVWPRWTDGDRALHLPPRRDPDPDAVVQRRARPAGPAAAPAPPRDARAGRPGRPGSAVPDGADRAGGHRRAVHRHPGRRSRRLPDLAAVPAGPRPPAGEAARHPGQDLLQVRRRQPGRLAQAEHRGAAGVLQPPGGRHPADHRDRRRAVGHRAGLRHGAVRHGVRGLAGPVVVRPEAGAAHDDGDLRRHAAPEPVGPHRGRPLGSWPSTPTPPARSVSRSPRRSRRPCSARTPATRSARCSTTCCCTRPSSARRR